MRLRPLYRHLRVTFGVDFEAGQPMVFGWVSRRNIQGVIGSRKEEFGTAAVAEPHADHDNFVLGDL